MAKPLGLTHETYTLGETSIVTHHHGLPLILQFNPRGNRTCDMGLMSTSPLGYPRVGNLHPKVYKTLTSNLIRNHSFKPLALKS